MTATDSAPTPSPSGSTAAPPLAGLRVLELADGIGGPYAGRLLAMLGATVVKVEPPGGDPARRKQVDDVPLADGETSALYLHLNAGKHNVAAADAPPLSWADVVLHNKVRSQLAGTDLDPSRPAGPDHPLLVTVTAWGFDADDPGTIEDELLVEAASGCIAVTGNDGDSPLRLPGWQAQYQAGATAAVGVLAALRMERTRHLDVPWIAALQVGMELEFADRLMAGRSRHPSGPFPPAAFPGGALPCKDGHVCPGSYRDVDWEMQSIFYEMPELYEDPRFNSRAARFALRIIIHPNEYIYRQPGGGSIEYFPIQVTPVRSRMACNPLEFAPILNGANSLLREAGALAGFSGFSPVFTPFGCALPPGIGAVGYLWACRLHCE